MKGCRRCILFWRCLGVETGAWGNPFDPQYQIRVTSGLVITDGLWKRAFGSDPHIVEEVCGGDNDLYRVRGMPAGFANPGRTWARGIRNSGRRWVLRRSGRPQPQFAVAPGNGLAP